MLVRQGSELENEINIHLCLYTNISTYTAQILQAPDEKSNLYVKSLWIANLKTCLFSFIWTGLPMSKHQLIKNSEANTDFFT